MQNANSNAPQKAEVNIMKLDEARSTTRWLFLNNAEDVIHAMVDLTTVIGTKARKAQAAMPVSSLAGAEPETFDVWELIIVQTHKRVCSVVVNDADYHKIVWKLSA